jgi:hypothetical protein
VSTRSRTATVLLSALLAPVLLAGCGGDDAAERAASATLSAEESGGGAVSAPDDEEDAADAAAATATFPADAEPDTEPASADAQVTVSDIRIGRHDGFDRVVFEVGGTGTPGWDVRYVDSPASQGSGEPIDVAGDAVLQVTVTGAGYPYATGVEEYSGPNPLTADGTETVTEVAFDATFEGTTVAFVGTGTQAPFRVYLLENPARVVLEVAHPG